MVLAGCSRPLYIKDKHFNCLQKEYNMDSDLKELIYKSLKRATVTNKDIPDYRLIWKKHRIYVLNEYQKDRTNFASNEDWNKSLSFLAPNEIPNQIENVSYCLKSKAELQRIADKTWEDFLYISFRLINIDGNRATIKIENTWNVSKHNKDTVFMSGGGYTCFYKKINGKWEFEKITGTWMS